MVATIPFLVAGTLLVLYSTSTVPLALNTSIALHDVSHPSLKHSLRCTTIVLILICPSPRLQALEMRGLATVSIWGGCCES